MLQDPTGYDVLSARRPSPWPLVGGIVAGVGLLSLLISAFSG